MSLKHIIVILLFYPGIALSQIKTRESRVDRLQYGAGFRISASIEASGLLLRASANAGIGYELGPAYPAYHLQFQLYNGGIGSIYTSPGTRLTADLAHSLTLTVGGKRAYRNMNAEKYTLRNSPLYYFSDFCPPPLQNPYEYSLSIGSNFIRAWGNGRAKCQRAGFGNIHAGAFQFSYSNDGTPFHPLLGINFGDGRDRYYTGDGFVAVHLSRKWEINTYMFSYHKFTGYYGDAFEIANSLYLGNVDYLTNAQQYFNRSSYNLSASSLDRGVTLSFDLRNRYFKDLQHLIHLNGYWVFHQVPYRYTKGATLSYFRSQSFVNPVQ